MNHLMEKIRHNWVAKALAVLAATLMWFFVVREQNPMVDISFYVAVQQQDLNSQYVVEGMPDRVRVTLRGPRDTMVRLKEEYLKAFVDLSNVKPGQNDVTIEMTPPSGVTVSDIRPEHITVVVDEYAEKNMPVEIAPLGSLPSDMAIKSLVIVPRDVTVSGPKALVDKVNRVIMKVDMANQMKNFTAQDTLTAVDSTGSTVDVTISPAQAQAQYELNRIRTDKALTVEGNIVGEPADGYEVKSASFMSPQVSVSGKPELLDELKSIQTEPIDISGASDTVTGTYNLIYPDGVTGQTVTVMATIVIGKKS